MLSRTSKIAIKAVVYLSGKNGEDEKTSVREIAEKINASEHTVGKALQKLVKNNIIHSMKGPTGGFYLSPEQKELPIYNIVETIEGEEVFDKCGLGLSKCSATHPCPIHNEYKEVRVLIKKIFKEKKVKDLQDNVSNGVAYLMG